MDQLTIGKVARKAGLRTSAIRYYERHKILPPSSRMPNGYRVYREDTVELLQFLQRAQAFGMTLRQIRELMELTNQGDAQCDRVQDLARHHLREVTQKIQALESLRTQLKVLLRKCSTRRTNQACPLIEGTVQG